MPLIDPVTMTGAGADVRVDLPKSSLPIELLPTDLARIFTHIHPALLASAYYLAFPAFVADPVSTLLTALLPLQIIQICYAVICLPTTGSSLKAAKKPKSSGLKKTTQAQTPKALNVLFAILLSLVSVPILAAMQVLFGAPITTHIPHTLLSSAHLAVLAVFPLAYVHGSDPRRWREIFSAYSPIDEVFGAAVGCLLGAWLGAVPIPLDWDREWQEWPVTIVTGAYVGYVVGKLAGGWLLRGKRIEFD